MKVPYIKPVFVTKWEKNENGETEDNDGVADYKK